MVLNKLANQIVENSLDVTWMKMRAHADNIANYSTPDYKAKRVDFHEVFESINDNMSGKMLMRATVSTDEETEARVDGNNVNMEYEQLEMWKAQAQYTALVNKMNSEYSNLRGVISTMSK